MSNRQHSRGCLRQLGRAPSQAAEGVERHWKDSLLVLFPFYLLPSTLPRSPLEVRGRPPRSPTSPRGQHPPSGHSPPLVASWSTPGTSSVDSSSKAFMTLQIRANKGQVWGTAAARHGWAARHAALVKTGCKYGSRLPFCSSVEEQAVFLKQRRKI